MIPAFNYLYLKYYALGTLSMPSGCSQSPRTSGSMPKLDEYLDDYLAYHYSMLLLWTYLCKSFPKRANVTRCGVGSCGPCPGYSLSQKAKKRSFETNVVIYDCRHARNPRDGASPFASGNFAVCYASRPIISVRGRELEIRQSAGSGP